MEARFFVIKLILNLHTNKLINLLSIYILDIGVGVNYFEKIMLFPLYILQFYQFRFF